MISYETKVKQWGNSMGVVLPKRVFESISVGKRVCISVSPAKELTGRRIFGKMPNIASMTQKEMDEIDAELDDLE
jgi:antitoxin component of MazEF toxin-antitoxin module